MIKLVVIVISTFFGYFVHMNLTAALASNFIFIHNAYLGSLIFFFLIVIQIFMFYWFIMKCIIFRKEKVIKFNDTDKIYFLIIYITFLVIGLFARPQLEYDKLYNFDIRSLFTLYGTNISPAIWFLNICIFVPLKFFFKNLNVKKFLALIILMEFAQALLNVGIFDINDLILYSVGYGLSSTLFKFYKKKN